MVTTPARKCLADFIAVEGIFVAVVARNTQNVPNTLWVRVPEAFEHLSERLLADRAYSLGLLLRARASKVITFFSRGWGVTYMCEDSAVDVLFMAVGCAVQSGVFLSAKQSNRVVIGLRFDLRLGLERFEALFYLHLAVHTYHKITRKFDRTQRNPSFLLFKVSQCSLWAKCSRPPYLRLCARARYDNRTIVRTELYPE